MSQCYKVLWPVVAVSLVLIASIVSQAPPLVFVSSMVGVSFVLGATFEWKHTNLLGAVLAGLFAVLSYQAGFFGNAMINTFFVVPMSLYGWWVWNNLSNKNQNNNIKRTLRKTDMPLLVGSCSAAFVASLLFSFFAGSSLLLFDAITTALPIIATILMVNAYKQHWYFWIVFNSIQVYMWFTVAGLDPSSLSLFVMKSVFLVNSFIGCYLWHKK